MIYQRGKIFLSGKCAANSKAEPLFYSFPGLFLSSGLEKGLLSWNLEYP
jgi:hypothetical protein